MKTGQDSDRIAVMITDEEKGLIYNIASKVRHLYTGESSHESFSHEDLIHYGIQGLCEAKQKFDGNRKIPFLFFAAKRVRGAMIDKLRRAPLVKVPQEQWQEVKILEQGRAELVQQAIEPTTATMAQHLGWSLAKVDMVMQRVFSYDSINTTGARDKGLQTSRPSPEDVAANQEITILLQQCLADLADTERLIVTCRFAIASQNQQTEKQTLQQLADKLERTAENIRQRQQKALNQLKTCLESHGLTNEDCHLGTF